MKVAQRLRPKLRETTLPEHAAAHAITTPLGVPTS